MPHEPSPRYMLFFRFRFAHVFFTAFRSHDGDNKLTPNTNEARKRAAPGNYRHAIARKPPLGFEGLPSSLPPAFMTTAP